MTKAKTPARKSTAPKTSARRKSPPPATLRPDQQRELFALGMILVAALTIVFYLTSARGLFGASWVGFTQYILGWGALLIPLSLGLLGAAILYQERRNDTKLTAWTVSGTLLVLAALLVMLEFAGGLRIDIEERPGEGGGAIGFALTELFSRGIGRPATFVLFFFAGIAGALLTFDITLHEVLRTARDAFARFYATVLAAGNPHQPADDRAPATSGDTRYTPPPDAPSAAAQRKARAAALVAGSVLETELMATPIAERTTKANLFRRPDAPEESTAKPAPRAAKPTAEGSTVLEELLKRPAVVVPTPPTEVVQAPLDGFEVSPIHHAWPMPSLDVLEHSIPGSITDDERRGRARLIEETLASFKVEAQVVGVNTGPAVTQFELQPAVGVKVSKITTLERDLALALSAKSLRIEAPIPGKNVVGIEIPNSAISTVSMREMVDVDDFEVAKGRLKLPLGKDVSGTPVVTGLDRMPHLLIAGSTGSGKSAAINTFICALLLKHTPDNLKFLMVDPKMVELIMYNGIPHLLAPVVTEIERVVPTLKWATREMERRYKVFSRHGFRNIDSYRTAVRTRADLEPMPYIVIIIDELADLMMMAPDEVETLICRLAQMARATGIHLIIATQRPSVDVVTGLIKANFPSRLAFAVTSQIDSRVILDSNGAEQLLGRGDALFMAADAARAVRVQGTYVSEPEIERIVGFWRRAVPPEEGKGDKGDKSEKAERRPADTRLATADPQPTAPPAMQGPAEFLSVDERDELLPEAIKLVQQHQRASASLLQRRLRIGYSKAAQLIELLEQQGHVGPAADGRSREVLRPGEDEPE